MGVQETSIYPSCHGFGEAQDMWLQPSFLRICALLRHPFDESYLSPKPPNTQSTKPSTGFEIGTLHSKPGIPPNSSSIAAYLSQCTVIFLNIELGQSGPYIAILVPGPPQPKFRVHFDFFYILILCYSIQFVRLLNAKSSILSLQPKPQRPSPKL